MKRFLTVLVALMIFGVAAFGNGPLLGVSTVPVAGGFAAMTVGYDFGEMNIEAWKANLTTPFGRWAIGCLWTPSIGTFGYRVGAEVVLSYVNITRLTSGEWRYDSFSFIVGVSKSWGPIQVYGEFDLMPVGILRVAPVVGVNILFGDLIPDTVAE
ncbi:MAG: hypothetical protein KAH23_08905 [Kiritimatiellae bacterium]|nr:hypothetical protein [Kiritimatiellia bacterium]